MDQGPTFLPPSPRPSARERILDSARTLFYRRGVVNVGIDEVIQDSGVAKATLYKHFPSKDALILEFMRQGDARWLAWLRETTTQRQPDPALQLYALFDTLQDWFSLPHFRGCLLTNAAVELADPLHPAQELLRAHKEGLRAYLQSLAQAAGVPAPRAPALAATLALIVEGATAQARLTRQPGVAQEAASLARLVTEAALSAAP